MTLIVTLKGKDGLVLAADSRGAIGNPRGLTATNDDHTKLFELSKYCGIGISGSSELTAKIVDELKAILNTSNHDFVNDILNKTHSLVRNCYNDWFAKFPVDKRPPLLLTLLGYQKTQDDQLVSRTYLLSSSYDFAPQLFPKGNCLRGVPQYTTYLMHRFYSPEMTVQSLTRLSAYLIAETAAYLIAETATEDPKVGGPIRIASITPNEGFKELDVSQVEKIVKLNNKQNEKLRQFFCQMEEQEVSPVEWHLF